MGERESDVMYYSVNSLIRPEYDRWVTKGVAETYFLMDFREAAEPFVQLLPSLVCAVDGESRRPVATDLELDERIPLWFYSYGYAGLPDFLLTVFNEEEGLTIVEHPAERLADLDFGAMLSSYLAFNEIFESLEESTGQPRLSVAMMVVLNIFAARIKLDAAEITGEMTYLSIHELALLAGMQEKSVRNVAHKEIGATYCKIRGRTVVPSDKALAWLKGRRRFSASYVLQTPAAREKLASIAENFFL